MNTDATGYCSVLFGDGTTTRGQLWVGNLSYASYGGASSMNYSANSGPHVWYTNYVERMRLDSNGNLGVGATPSAWSPVFRAIQMQNGTCLASHPSVPVTYLNSNYYFDGTNDRYVVNGYASSYIVDGYQGGFTWRTAVTGTAGGVISFNERMRITAAGNVGIGNTAPGKKLEVTVLNPGNPVPQDGLRVNIGGLNADQFSARLYVATTGVGVPYAQLMGPQDGNGWLAFTTGSDTERMRIDGTGNVMVGTTANGNSAFSVEKAMGAAARFENTQNTSGDIGLLLQLGANTNNTSSYFLIAQEKGIQNRLFIYGNGNVVNLNGSYGTISDIKVKENVFDATPKLDKLLQIRVINYNLIGETQKLIGVVAQELEHIFPGMIDVSPDRDAKGNDLGTTTKSVKYSVFVPMLIKAMQEQQALITSLTARVAQLEGK